MRAGTKPSIIGKIAALGGEPLELPVIKIVPPKEVKQLDQALQASWINMIGCFLPVSMG